MNLDAMNDNKLEQLFRNCLAAIMENKPNKAHAEILIGEINAVWQRRLSAADAGDYKGPSVRDAVRRDRDTFLAP